MTNVDYAKMRAENPRQYKRCLKASRDWKDINPARVKLYAMREKARVHAHDTGKDVLAVYKSMGCLLDKEYENRPLRTKLTCNENAHPIMKIMLSEMNTQRMSPATLCKKSGIGRSSFERWRKRFTPSYADIEACFNVLGYTLQPTKVRKAK